MSLYSLQVKTIDGQPQTLDAYQGKVLLIVNVASQCGFTPQYAGLEALYQQYKDQGFVILGFPCNQFGAQEPGTEAEIQSFCSRTYNVTFPMFAKIDVNGNNTHPLYQYLKSSQKGIFGMEAIKWNFTKFLIDRSGKVVKRYSSMATPESIAKDVAALLG